MRLSLRGKIYVSVLFLVHIIGVNSYSSVDSLRQELKKSKDTARIEILHQLVNRLYNTDEEASLEYAKEALQLSYSIGSNIHIARSLVKMVKSEFRNEKWEKISEHYYQALYYLQRSKIKDIDLAVSIYSNLQHHYSIVGNSDSSEYYKNKWYQLLLDEKDFQELGIFFLNSGYYCLERNEGIDKADSLFVLSFNYLQKHGDNEIYYNRIIDAATYYNMFGHYQKAYDFLDSKYSLFVQLNIREAEQKYFYFLGFFSWHLNKYIEGIDHILKSIEIGKTIKSSQSSEFLAFAYELLGVYYTNLELWEQAEKNYKSAIEYGKNQDDERMYVKMLMNYGTLFMNRDSVEKALSIFSDIKDDFIRIFSGNEEYYLSFMLNYADCFFQLNKKDSIKAIIKEIEVYNPNLDIAKNLSLLYSIKYKYEYLSGNYKKSMEYLEALSENIAYLYESPDEQLKILDMSHRILFKLGRFSDSYKALEIYNRFKDSLKTNKKIHEIGYMHARLESQKEILDEKLENEELKRKERQNTVIITLMIIAGAFLIVFVIVVLRERAKSEKLLLNILPEKIAKRLKRKEKYIAEKFNDASIMFIDIAQFTKLSSGIAPERLVEILNDIFTIFDDLSEKHGLEKIKTIGDCYLAVAGIPEPRIDHVTAAADMALDVIKMIDNYVTDEGIKISFRIGIDCGPVVAGIIGRKKFIYDLWGDTVNQASRMEDFGVIGEIQVTDRFKNSVEQMLSFAKNKYYFVDRGIIEIKGKGQMRTWFLRNIE